MTAWWRADKTLIMGVVNVTPDSFSDGGQFINADKAIEHGLQLVREGADVLDIGGESTRPGAAAVSVEDECARILPVIEGLRDCGVPLSIDTRHAATMRAAIRAGAGMINDVTALRGEEDSMAAVAESDLPVCLMHMQGEPQSMQDNPHYNNVMDDLLAFFEERIAACEKNGIAREQIVIDPGIGFGKRLDHNLDILRNVSVLRKWDIPILIGVSRKRFINELCNVPDPSLRGPGTIAASLQAVAQGANIIRVHDVAAMRQALTVFDAVRA
ncbi:MAG: dihydropteroate synthase [Alphaproteobacteria bacterium]|nr:dihydropteroate synthase [Alphaproteobacteria bacterium]MBU0859552.1 dihydropteroate synthase [Alphaproteobacteria bacterium]